jgi:hypothetical protein
MKTTKKTTKKVIKKPDFVVDWTDIETNLDIPCEVIRGKVRAGLPISVSEADALERRGFYTAADTIEQLVDMCDQHTTYIEDDKLANDMMKLIKKYQTKKQPWYKRFWRWITFRK